MPLATVETIQSERLSLRPVADQDLPDILEVNGDPEVTRFLPYATWETHADGIAWLERMRALSAVLTHALRKMAIRRIEAEVDPANAASNALLVALGFAREGLLRQRWVARGRACDVHAYGLLAAEWSCS